MGNSQSNLLTSRRTEESENTAVISDLSASASNAVRERDTSSSHLPRKRNRFSLLRNPFRHGQSSASLSSRNSTSPPRRRHRGTGTLDRGGISISRPPSLDPARQGPETSVPSIVNSAGSTNMLLDQELESIEEIAPTRDMSNDSEAHETFATTHGTSLQNGSDHGLQNSSPINISNDTAEIPARVDPTAAAQVHDMSTSTTESATQEGDTSRVASTSSRDAGMPAEEQAGILARLLSIAAAATAASLISSNQRSALRDAREINPASIRRDGQSDSTDYVDGSFDGFLTALQNGRLAQALRAGNDRVGAQSTDQHSLNFFRMFRFPTTPDEAESARENTGANENTSIRMVPIIIVGIRSVRPGGGLLNQDSIPPFFGALQAMEQSDSAEASAESTSGLPAHPSSELPLFTSDPPVTSSNPTTPLANSTNAAEPFSDVDQQSSNTISMSPSFGPASNGSVAGAEHNPPRSSISPPPSGIMDSVLDRLRSLRPDHSTTSAPSSPRRRSRRPTWRPFSSAESRDRDNDASARSNSASFLVYVLGGTYPENHPILTTPSLFMDTPSYEDMLMLTSLIGPATPQTADSQDLESAGLSYDLPENADELDSRCQVCLSNYEVGNACRRLATCGHLFHKECIDEWLTTGRNNCPMCRADTAARTKPLSEATTTTAGNEETTGALGDSIMTAA